MKTFIKKTIVVVLAVSIVLGVAGYVGYRFYQYAILDASEKIRSGVAEGVQEGVGGAFNPIKMVKKLFGKK
ncbi:MAG: hypothetical protein ACD_64C00119G0001 [uncultured bacterium]|nr:MAG: hypothetical protein ACD_64C00119G0001 [uncultured bacterium]